MPDTEIPVLDHFTGRQLRELLALGSSDRKTTRDWLLEIRDLEHLEYLLTEMCAGTGQSADALLQAVRSPDTPVEVLIAVKSAAKHFAVAAENPVQKAAATLLYHLSIASALGRHSRKISSKDPAGRLALYRDLAAELSDDELAAIFEKAVARLTAASD